LVELQRSGTPVGQATRFTQVALDSAAGPLVWIGDRFGTAWNDRRDTQGPNSNYEIYFNEVGSGASKLGPDLRVTNDLGFSVNPSLAWTGTEFVAFFQDDDPAQIFGQRIGLDQSLTGGNVAILPGEKAGQENPAVAVGPHTLGLAWMEGDATSQTIRFATLHPDLSLASKPIEVSVPPAHAVSPTLAVSNLGYTLAWYYRGDQLPIYASVVDESGALIVPPRPVTQSSGYTRFPQLLSYGDRVLLVWSDDRDNNGGYELYAKVLDSRLNAITSEMRLTNARGDSINPLIAFGPAGDIGVIFLDDRNGRQVYFTRLLCGAAR
jgi:hypothetical protein